MRFIIIALALILSTSSFAAQPKEWTFLLFLNGNNNLDKYGHLNMNQIESVGSTDKINIVVQWASLKTGKVQRLLMQKDGDSKNVTSPVIQDLGNADMGNWKTLVDFVQWGAKNFPANHYFVDVWDHGSGWHELENNVVFKDISHDDTTGHHMTTKELAMALSESSKAIGQKIDIYGSDACLMGMLEIASEVSPSVNLYIGSEDLEPGEGWPYDRFFARWNNTPSATSKDVAKMLTEEYAKSYTFTGSKAVTLSAFNLNALPELELSIQQFGEQIKKLGYDHARDLRKIARNSQSFYNSDYVDFLNFVSNVKSAKLSKMNPIVFNNIETSSQNFIIANGTVNYPDAHGMSLWIPAKRRIYSKFSSLYQEMRFDQQTHWSDVAKLISE